MDWYLSDETKALLALAGLILLGVTALLQRFPLALDQHREKTLIADETLSFASLIER